MFSPCAPHIHILISDDALPPSTGLSCIRTTFTPSLAADIAGRQADVRGLEDSMIHTQERLQQLEQEYCPSVTTNDAFRPVCKFWDRITRPEHLMSTLQQAMRVLTDPAETGAVCVALSQDVEGESYDYPDYFLEKRVWYVDRRLPSEREIDAAVEIWKLNITPRSLTPVNINNSATPYFTYLNLSCKCAKTK